MSASTRDLASLFSALTAEHPARLLFELSLTLRAQYLFRDSLSQESIRSLEGFREIARELKVLMEPNITLLFSHLLGHGIELSDQAIAETAQILEPHLYQASLPELANLYERFVSPQDANKAGVFYTPLPIVERIVRETLTPVLDLHGGTLPHDFAILDPACGSGVFLLELLRFLSCNLDPLSEIERKRKLLSHILYGIDRDPLAIEVTRLLALLSLADRRQLSLLPEKTLDLRRHFRSGNSLLEKTHFDLTRREEVQLMLSLGVFSWQEAFPEVHARGGFDVVLGNPPYGLSRDEQMSPEENEKLKHVYRNFRRGKVNKYLLFMARGYELLTPHGTLSYVVPNAWLGIKGGTLIRKAFISDQALESVTVFRCKVFDEPSVEAVIFRVDKSRKNRSVKVRHAVSLQTSEDYESFDLPTKVCTQHPDFLIPVQFIAGSSEVLAQIRRSSVRLGDPASPFVPLIALQAYTEGRGVPPQTLDEVKGHVFHCSSKLDETCYPYLEGSDVKRYQIRWSGTFLRYGPWLAEPQTIDRFSGPRVLVREIVSPAPAVLSATFVKEPLLYNKSVLHIRGKGNLTDEWYLALVGLLNSCLGSWYVLQHGRKSQRKIFPKIVNEDLLDFPLSKDFAAHVSELAQLVTHIQTLAANISEEDPRTIKSVWWPKSQDSQSISKTQADLISAQAELDDRVFSIYDLKNSDVTIIRSGAKASK